MMKLNIQMFAQNKVIIEAEMDTKNFDAQIESVEAKLNDLRAGYEEYSQSKGFNEQSLEAKQFRAEIEKAENTLADLYKKQNAVANQDYSNVKSNLSGIGNSMEHIIKKVVKWGLAVFGIRSMYMLVRRSISVLSEYNDQLATDVEYIRFALASVLQPVIEFIIKLAYKILSIVASIVKLITGKNIFKNAGVDKFNSKLDKSDKKAKKLQKTLAGFDEMNILNPKDKDDDDSDYKTPSQDLSKGLGNIKPIDWKKWVTDAWEWIKKNWKAVLVGILAVIAGLLMFKVIRKVLSPLAPAIKGFFKAFGVALEIIAILGGLYLVIKAITELIDTFVESGMSLNDALILIATTLGTVAIAFTIMALATKAFNIEGIAGALVILGGLALILHELSSLFSSIAKSGMDVNDVADIMVTLMGTLLVLVAGLTIAILALSSPMALVGALALVGAIAGVLFTIKATLPTILKAVGNFTQKVAPPLIAVMNTIKSVITGIIKALGTTLPPIIREVGNVFKTIFNGINKVIKTISNSIIRVLNAIIDFVNKLGPGIEGLVNSIITSVTKLINFVISGIEYMVNNVVIAGINGIIGAINKVGSVVGIELATKEYVNFPRFTPRLAKGAIASYPGKGIPTQLGNARWAEAGQEAYLPLTDSQVMSMLGQEIGKNVVINANITNSMNGRVISRELQKVQNQSDFAFNR